jgi:hypothetical protein
MIAGIIKYGRYAPLLTGILLIWSAISPAKPGVHSYWRVAAGIAGAVLIFVTVKIILNSK